LDADELLQPTPKRGLSDTLLTTAVVEYLEQRRIDDIGTLVDPMLTCASSVDASCSV
jgi:hypothetical protein